MDIITTIFNFIVEYFNAPAIALLVLFCGAFYVLKSAQRREDFDLGNMFKNESNKESAIALGAIIAIVLSGWALVYDTFSNKQVDPQIFLIYLCVWSGTKVAEKLIDALTAKWSK